MLGVEPEPPNFDSMNILAKRSPRPPHDFDPTEDLSSTQNSDSLGPEYTPTPQHSYAGSSYSRSRHSRRSIASLAREKSSNVLANLASISTVTSPTLRSATSSGSLSKQTGLGLTVARPTLPKSFASASNVPHQRRSGTPLPEYSTTRSPTPSMARTDHGHGKMHQTSSKVLRMTNDDRPFAKEFNDLFSTLITSLPLTPHRVRFSRVEETFLSEEAITNLGSLKFSQSNRIPDPKNPSRWVVTTTTTTFSMAKEMARSICQRFVDARFIESADNRYTTVFSMKGGVWQLTPKGRVVLSRFCMRNGINARHIEPLLRREQMQIVGLERDPETDKLSQDKGTIEVIFRRFAGHEGPNLKANVQLSDSDSVSEYANGLLGVKMAKERRIIDKMIPNSFTGKAASDWLMDCCTTVDRRETYEMCEMFVKSKLVTAVTEDRAYRHQNPAATLFQPTKHAIYTITEKGQQVCGWLARDPSISSTDSRDGKEKTRAITKDSNNTRLSAIMLDPALRLLFREFLRLSMCEENLSFYQDVAEFTNNYRQLEASGKLEKPEAVRETLGNAYSLYNAFLASGAPSELNIDHSLRNKLDGRMIRSNSNEEDMLASLAEIVDLFEQAQRSVYKLMSSDSVPKFCRDPRYQPLLKEYEWEFGPSGRAFSPTPMNLPDRTRA